MAWFHSIQRFSRTEWELSNREGYTCTVNLTKDGSTCSCNLLQLQKLPCAHVITAYAQDCANISIFILCAQWYTEDNYNKIYAGPFHPVINYIGQGEVGLLCYHWKLGGRRVVHLMFAYAVLWMKGVKVIDAIDVIIANNWVVIRLGCSSPRGEWIGDLLI